MTINTVQTVLVIDDHPLFRKGAADLIAMDSSLRMIGEASSGEEGLERALALKPDLILLDLQMKGMEGTVKVHVKHLLKKLNLHSRVEAAVWAVKKV